MRIQVTRKETNYVAERENITTNRQLYNEQINTFYFEESTENFNLFNWIKEMKAFNEDHKQGE